MSEYVELERDGFDIPAQDSKPGPRVLLLWELQLSSGTWNIEGFLHWDRHEGEKTSRAPRWRFTRMADERTWASFKGKQSSVESQAGLTPGEFHHMGQIKEKMLRQLSVRKSELQKSNTLINWEEEDRWQRFKKAAKCYRHSKELLALREKIEEDRRNAGPLHPEWQPVRTRRAEMQVEKKPQAQAEAAISSGEDEDEVDKENAIPRPKPVSALLKDEALAMSEIEAASDLWKKLEHLKPGDEQNIFTADELNTLWRVAIAKARTRITHDTQLPFHCLDLAKQQLVSRSNDALVRLLCVIHSAQAAGHQKEIRDFIRAFIRSLVRELLDQVFTEQGELLSLIRFKDQPDQLKRCAREALRGSSAVEVAAGFAVLCGPETAGIIAELFKPEDLKRPTVAAATFGALLVAESQDVNKVLALVAEILRPGAADLLLQFSLHSLLKTLQNQEVDCTLQQLEVPKLPSTADELRKRIASLPKLLAAWRPSPGAGPIVPIEVLKELRSSVQDQDLFCAILGCFSRHAADQTGEIKLFVEAAKHGLLFMWRLYSNQSKSVLRTKVDQSVANCLAVTLPTLPQEGLQLLRKAFAVSDRSWPRCSGDSPTFGLFQQLSGKKFSELFDQPELRHRAKWIIRKTYNSSSSEKHSEGRAWEQLEQFSQWALPKLSGESMESQYLLRLPTPGSGQMISIDHMEVRLGYANQICDLLAQLLRKLPEPPPEIYGFCAFAVLQGALLALAINKPSSSGEVLLRLFAPEIAKRDFSSLNNALTAAKLVLPAKQVPSAMQDWVFASFARDLHKLMLWLQAFRSVEPQAAEERIKHLWCVACLAARHLKGRWAPLPQCPEDFQLIFNPLRRRAWPGSSNSLDDKTWALRPVSALLAYPEEDVNVPDKIDSSNALLRAAKESPCTLSWGSFAEALSGSDVQDWVRLRPWRQRVLGGMSGKDQKHLRAAIFSRVSAVHRCVARHQQKRSAQPMMELMLTELLRDADFICQAMDEFRSLCRSEPWAKAAEAPAAEEGLWTFRSLLYFRNALQGLAMDLREAGAGGTDQLKHVRKGLTKLSNCLELIDGDQATPQDTENHLRAAEISNVSANAGVLWEEIAPPTDSPDGCFGREIRHNFGSILTLAMATRAGGQPGPGVLNRFLAERTAKVAALARAKQWQKAVFLALVETPVHLQDLRLRNAALAALGRGIRWTEALALLPSKPMASSINAVLGACDKAKCWSKALQLWKATSPDLITYNTAIAACFGSREYWQLRLHDWARHPSTQQNLLEVGFAILPQALRPMEVDGLLRELPHLLEGGAVRMEEQSKGNGGYDYLKQLPLHLSNLREVAYESFLASANELLQQHCLEVSSCGRSICNELDVRERRGELPNTLKEFETLCERRGRILYRWQRASRKREQMTLVLQDGSLSDECSATMGNPGWARSWRAVRVRQLKWKTLCRRKDSCSLVVMCWCSKKWLRSVTLKKGKEQDYILHDPGGRGSRPVLLFLHGASSYIYPELLHWDIHDLLAENSVVREEFIILAPFGSIGEPVVKSQKKLKSDRFYNMVPYVKCFDPDILWDFFMSALKDLWNDGNSEKRFDPARLHVTGYSLGGQATWALSCFYGSCLASAAPMAAKCAWEEDSWDHGAKILQELRHLPVWTYACKWDFTAFSHEDHWWIAEHRDLDIYAKEVEVLTEGSVHGICHQWSEDLTLTLLQGTPSHHNAWAPDVVLRANQVEDLSRARKEVPTLGRLTWVTAGITLGKLGKETPAIPIESQQRASKDNALSIFQHLCSHAAEPDVVSWNSLVKACSRSSWRAAWVALSNSKVVTAQGLTSCTAAAPWKWALDRLTLLEVNWRLQPDLVLYNTLIGTCSSASDWQPALELLCKQDRSENVSPDIISYNSVITSRLIPNRVTFNSLLSACDGAGDWQNSIELLMDLIYSTLEPDPASLTAESIAAIAVAKGFVWDSAIMSLTELSAALHDWTGHWQMAVEEWQIWRQRGVLPSTDFFNAVVSAGASTWQMALQLFREVTGFRIRLNQVSYAVALNACSTAQLWLEAMSLLHEAQHFPSSASNDLMMCFNTAMSCCEHSTSWNLCLEILQHLLQAFVEPDQKSYRSPLRTSGYGHGWRTALGLLWHMAQGLAKLQRKTLRTALVALSRYQGTRSPAWDLPPLTGGLGSINAQQQFTTSSPSNPSLMVPPRRGNLGRRAATSQL
eukprot:symbB.v1.2.005990.t1/scaffold276.1/size251734/12